MVRNLCFYLHWQLIICKIQFIFPLKASEETNGLVWPYMAVDPYYLFAECQAACCAGTICSATSSLNYSSAFSIKSSTARLEGRLRDMQAHSFTVSAVTIKTVRAGKLPSLQFCIDRRARGLSSIPVSLRAAFDYLLERTCVHVQ